jgi:hypothetical protein
VQVLAFTACFTALLVQIVQVFALLLPHQVGRARELCMYSVYLLHCFTGTIFFCIFFFAKNA